MSEVNPIWRFVENQINPNGAKWTPLGDNVITGESNESNEHYLTIYSVTRLNEGWYACFGQYSDIYFVSLGFLRIVGR